MPTPLMLNYALTLVGFTAVTASRMLVPLYALKLGAEPFAVGMLAAMFHVFPLFLAWPVGKLSDRYGPRLPLTGSVVCGAGAMLLPFFIPSMPVLFVAAALSGVSFGLFLVNVQNLVGVLSAADRRAEAFSNFSLVASSANFTGPMVGGFSIDHWGHPAACVIAAGLYVAGLVMLIAWGRLLPGGSKRQAKEEGSMLRSLADPGVRRILASSSLVQLGTDLFQFYMPVYGHAMGLTASAIGIVLASFAAASFVIRYALPKLIALGGESRVLVGAFLLGGASFAVLPVAQAPLSLCLVASMFGLGMGVGQPIVTMMMFSRSATGRSGEALGLRLTANNLVRVTGPSLFGYVASAFGLVPVFYVSALMMACGGLLARPPRSSGKDQSSKNPSDRG
jgi:predicted MFS family arabinose efflux permease